MKLTTQQFKDGTCSDFFFEGHNVRVRMNDKGDIFFVAKDVAEALGLSWDGNRQLSKIPDDWKMVGKLPTSFGEKETTFITEAAVYKLGFRSNKKQAERFTNWVASEVLPTLRKTGSYSTKPQTGIDISGISDLQSAALVKAIIDSDRALQEVQKVESKVNIIEGKVEGVSDRMDRFDGDNGYRTVLAYQKDRKLSLSKNIAAKIGKLSAKLCRELEKPIGKSPDERFGSVNSYPVDVLEKTFNDFFGSLCPAK